MVLACCFGIVAAWLAHTDFGEQIWEHEKNFDKMVSSPNQTFSDETSPPLTTPKLPNTPAFKKEVLPDEIYEDMIGVTIHENSIMKQEDLSYLTLSYYGYDGKTHIGNLIMAQTVADDIIEIFKILYNNQYPIEKMVLPDVYDGVDELSMQDNNTSGYNDRPIDSSGTVSYHQLGRAVDINPLYNPYIKFSTNDIQPKTGKEYLNRETNVKGMIHENDICVQAFKARGWKWGGDWTSVKDYQHFEKPR